MKKSFILWCCIMSALNLSSLESKGQTAEAVAALEEEAATIAINFTIHNNHQSEQNNAVSSSTEQTVTKQDQENEQKELEQKINRMQRIMNLLKLCEGLAGLIIL